MRDKLKAEILSEVQRILTVYNAELLDELRVIQELVEKIESLANLVLYPPKPKLSDEPEVRGFAEREFREEEMSEEERIALHITKLTEAIKDQITQIENLMNERKNLTVHWILDIEYVVDKYSEV